jgi:Cu(I)/Ag(I) efflux system membrane protein CusA/SilA
MGQSVAVEGRERYPIRLRYTREHRSDLDEMMETLVMTPTRGEVPLRMVADAKFTEGPPMISSENGLLRSLVYLNIRGRDLGSTIEALDKALAGNLELPPGYYYRISGQWENELRAARTLSFIMPIVLLVILVLLYITFNSLTDSLIVMLSVPFALIGGVLLVAHYHYNLSVAVWVGFIALFGMAVNTGVLMLVYLNEAMDRVIAEKQGADVKWPDVLRAAYEGSALRLRPKLMTVATSLLGLMPIMWESGTGSEVMRPIAVPLIGGMISSTILVLLVIPVIFSLARWVELRMKGTLEPRGHTGLS